MTTPRVLIVSFLPPSRGGIATWAGILRDNEAGLSCRFTFEDLGQTGNRKRRTTLGKFAANLRLLARLAHRAEGELPDVLHLNCCLSALGVWRDLWITALARARRVRVVVHFHGSLPDVLGRLPLSSRLAWRALTASANVAVAVTRSSELFLRCRGYPVEYLPSVVEDEWFDPRRRRAPRDTTGARVAYAGRLSRDKGTLELLQAARLLPQLVFFLMGELTDEIRSDVQSAPDNVISTGHLPRPEVMERLRTSDIFAFPSHREGCPNAVVEAMASGLPVVATRVGGLPEMIDEGRGGYLVEPGDSPALAQALARLAADPHLARRLGEHNRAVGRERFALSVVCRRLERIYEGVAREISEKGKQRNPRAPRLGLPSEKVGR